MMMSPKLKHRGIFLIIFNGKLSGANIEMGQIILKKSYRVSQKKRSLRISKPLGPTDASGDNSVGKGCWRDVG